MSFAFEVFCKLNQGDEVGGNNIAICARKLSCGAWVLDWNVDIDFL